MKKRVASILSVTLALVLVSGLAYAAKKKVPGRAGDRTTDPTHEEETLSAELLDAAGNSEQRVPSLEDDSLQEIAQATAYEKFKDRVAAGKPGK